MRDSDRDLVVIATGYRPAFGCVHDDVDHRDCINTYQLQSDDEARWLLHDVRSSGLGGSQGKFHGLRIGMGEAEYLELASGSPVCASALAVWVCDVCAVVRRLQLYSLVCCSAICRKRLPQF